MTVAITSADAFFTVMPVIVIVALGAGYVLALRQRSATRREAEARRVTETALPPAGSSALGRPRVSARPWWGNPWLWLIACLAFAVLGLVVWPGLFGGTFLLLPFVWVRRPRREASMDPRTNGHTERDPEAFTED